MLHAFIPLNPTIRPRLGSYGSTKSAQKHSIRKLEVRTGSRKLPKRSKLGCDFADAVDKVHLVNNQRDIKRQLTVKGHERADSGVIP